MALFQSVPKSKNPRGKNDVLEVKNWSEKVKMQFGVLTNEHGPSLGTITEGKGNDRKGRESVRQVHQSGLGSPIRSN